MSTTALSVLLLVLGIAVGAVLGYALAVARSATARAGGRDEAASLRAEAAQWRARAEELSERTQLAEERAERDGAVLRAVLPETARHFGRAIVMPNLVPPVVTGAEAAAYRDRILAALPEGMDFTPLMTLYLTEDTDPDDVAAAHASARLIGRGDEKAADQAAVNAMREQLNMLDIKGVVVIGEGERDEAPMLFIGERLGTGTGPRLDIAVDPLEGTTLCAKDMPGAIAVMALAEGGSLTDPAAFVKRLNEMLLATPAR